MRQKQIFSGTGVFMLLLIVLISSVLILIVSHFLGEEDKAASQEGFTDDLAAMGMKEKTETRPVVVMTKGQIAFVETMQDKPQ